MPKTERWNDTLLKGVVELLSKKQFIFKEITNHDECAGVKSEPSVLGNYLWLITPGDLFLPFMINQNHMKPILEFTDNFVRKKVYKKFPMLLAGLYNNPVNATPRKVANILHNCFAYYECVWQRLKPENVLISHVDQILKEVDAEILKIR
jgi:hypothetical protein